MRINFDAGKTGLPVVQIIPSVKEHLLEHNTLIVSAAPGAGKSTVLPLALLNEPWLEGRKILMLEPRRLAAGTIAVRMASLLNEQVGQTVGYRVRFESKVSARTRIEVVTEGILTRMLQDDNALEEVGLVIFDEFHERSINADIALALCRESQLILRPDLKILVMSATLDTKRLSDILFAAVVESTGSLFPVEKIYTGGQDLASLPTLAARTAIRALEEKEGDILVFLPGQGEILKCEGLLKDLGVKALVRPLYGQLSFSDQNAAIMPDPDGRRKIVLATSIAETSLTIEGIRIVIDSGFARSAAFDPRTGLSGLRTAPISLDSAEQRAGRAGRLSSGVCYRMWSLADQERMEDYRTPEIQEADLAPLVLEMLKWGVNDIMRLTWLTRPPASSLERAKDLLSQLGAMQDGRITGHGKQIHALPCHPRLAHMLLMASDDDLLPLATDVAALLEERDPLDRASSIDINLRIEALRRYRGENRKERRMDNIDKIAASYRRMLRAHPDNGTVDPYATGLLLSYAFPERIACLRPEQTGQFKLANGKMAAVNADDDLAHEPWLVIAQLDARQGMGKAFLAAPLNPRDLYLIAQEKNNITWDTRKGGLIASRDRLVGSILLESRPIRFVPDEQVVLAVSNALRTEGETLLCFTDETEQWQNRVLSLRSWRSDEEWPDVSIPALLASIDGWLSPYLSQIRKVDDLRRLDLVTILQQRLSYEQQQALDSLAPAAIKVPSGSWIKLKYSADGGAPVLSVRLQEVFGMLDTPRVNGGRQGVVLHLLSPGFKPVQVTSDLRSFWENTYFEVRKELKRRYPKHSWPEEPLRAEAVSGVKRKK